MMAVSEMRRWLGRLELKHVVLFLMVLAVVVRLSTLVLFKIHPTIAFAEMEKIARNLAENGTFANPYKIPTGPTAHHAPIYPMLLSLIFRTFGYGAAAAYAMAVMNICFAGLHYALLPVLTDVAEIDRMVGVTAGLLGALVPYRIMRELRWETTLLALTIILLILVTTHWWQTLEPSRFHSFCVGLAWGTGMLCSPVLLPVFLLILLSFGLFVRNQKRPRARLITVAIATLGMVVAVAPWTIRNYRALGGFVFVRSNLGLELDLSNNPEAHATFADNLSIGFPNNYYHQQHPWASREHAEMVGQLGEIKYNRQRMRQAGSWVRMEPRGFAKLTLERFVFFWFAFPRTQPLKFLLLALLTVVASLGLWLAIRRHRPLGLSILCLWIGYPVAYYILQTDGRYRYPIDWTFTLLAVYILTKPLWKESGFERRA